MTDLDSNAEARRTQRLIEAARRAPLPEGTYPIGAGLLIAGLTAYGFQILSFRQLTEEQYNALNGLWVLIFIVAPGFFQPLEQEVSRALAHRRAQGLGGGPLVKRAALLGGILTTIALAAVAAGAPALLDHLFHEEGVLLAALVVGVLAYYLAHMTRGTLSGNGRFVAYGTMHGAEGLARLFATIALVVVGVATPGPYGMALVLPPVLAVLISLRGQHDLLLPGPPAPYSELSTALGFLLLGSLFAQVLSYAAYLGANLLADASEKESVGRFAAGLYIARIPILLFQAVQAALLPKLAGLAGSGQTEDFRSGMRKLIVIVVALGAIGTVGGFTLGSFAGGVLFGDKFELGNRDLGLLALGCGGFILALTLAQGLIALRGYGQATTAWFAGIVGFVVVTALGDDLFLRVELGFVAGALTAAAVMAAFLMNRLRGTIPSGAVDDLVQTIGHEPLEI